MAGFNPMYNNYNPMYNNQPMNYPINGYQERLGQYQQPGIGPMQNSVMPQVQNQQNPNLLNARVVDDFNTLNANDVPMDGNGAIFMKRDASEIQWRNWAANGTIVTTPYKPIVENKESIKDTPTMNLNTLYEDVKALRQEISERFDRLEKSMTNTNKQNNSKPKKEAVIDEPGN